MTKHGHGLPRKRPGRSAQNEIEAELPELEPLAELPELESLDDLPELEAIEEEDEGPVKATCKASDDAGFDTEVTVDVPEMPKKDVADALEAPLTRIAGTFSELLRHQKVLVRFTGDALIGTAIKALVTDKFSPEKPLLLVVRRGFGDERVHEGVLPTVEVTSDVVDGETKVQVATGDCELADLPMALASHMVKLTESGRDARFLFQFKGGAKPDATMRDAMSMAFRDAGAKSCSIGARVLFDRELEDRIKCSVSGNKVAIAISLTDDDATIIDALTLVLPGNADAVDGKNVRYQFARESAAVQDFCVDFARNAGATLIEVGGQDDTDIVWPPLISVRAGKEVELRLSPNGRSRAAVLSAFERECAEHHEDAHGKHVVIDWPQDFALDAEALKSLDTVMTKLSPKRLCCTVAGDLREPFYPEPIAFDADGEVQAIRVDTESGKPRDLQRAMDRCLPAKVSSLRGQSVRVEFVGDGAVSRTFRQNVCTAVAEAGAMRLEVVEGGEHDVLLPPMLAVVEGDAGFKVSIVIDGRDETQQRRALIREFEGVEVALQSVTIASSSAAQAVGDYVLEQGASRVVLDGAEPMQIHPPLFESAKKEGKEARFVIEPTGDDAMDLRMLAAEMPARIKGVGLLVAATATIVWPGAAANHAGVVELLAALRNKNASTIKLDGGAGDAVQLHPEPKVEEAIPELTAEDAVAPVAATPAKAKTAPSAPAAAAPPPLPAAEGALVTLLGRRDESVPPVVMIGIAAGEDDAHIAAIEAELQAHLPRFNGRAVLLIPHLAGIDVPVRRQTPLATMLGRVVPTGAAATLVFRGPDAQGRPHFQVLQSSLRALPVGATFGDPRATKQPS
ncbi:MAG: hypothetical protein ACI89X_000146 [Planctomycetota bacterium]|jgi:hypothetical protein